MEIKGNNELIHMTRRIPTNLKKKQLAMDSKVATKLIRAWDIEHDADKVLRIFLKYEWNLSNQRYWELMRTVWIVCGSVEQSTLFRGLMESGRPFRHWFSTPEERTYLENLPNQFLIYRAIDVTKPDDRGLSWTLSYKYVMQYAEDFNKEHIKQKWISKSDVFAYINRNNEQEIIIL